MNSECAWNGSHAKLALWINLLVFKLAAVLISILALFLIFWLLPNRRIPAGAGGARWPFWWACCWKE
jgi:uncharacterized BrkB/YihY/UPF0761 family membrane protein